MVMVVVSNSVGFYDKDEVQWIGPLKQIDMICFLDWIRGNDATQSCIIQNPMCDKIIKSVDVDDMGI